MAGTVVDSACKNQILENSAIWLYAHCPGPHRIIVMEISHARLPAKKLEASVLARRLCPKTVLPMSFCNAEPVNWTIKTIKTALYRGWKNRVKGRNWYD